jgi:hypothetical protein
VNGVDPAMAKRNPDLIDTLRATLRQIEQSGEVATTDAAMQQLRRSLVLAIADLERAERHRETAA